MNSGATRRAIGGLFVALLLAEPVAGDEENKGAAAKQSPRKVYPEVKLEEKADGTGELSVKVAYGRQIGPGWNVEPGLTYSAATKNGVASLFQVTDDVIGVARDWSIGANFTFNELTHAKRPAAFDALEDRARERAYDRCVKTCVPLDFVQKENENFCTYHRKRIAATLSKPEFCPEEQESVATADEESEGRPGREARRRALRSAALERCYKPCKDVELDKKKTAWCSTHLPDVLSPAQAYRDATYKDFCPAGQRDLDDVDKLLPASHFPRTIVNLGAKAGQTHFSFLSPTSSGQFAPDTSAPPTFHVGTSGAYIASEGNTWTAEWLATFGTEWESASDTAHYCRPAGTVQNAATGGDPAQICKDQPLGRPVRSNLLTLAAYLGTLDQNNDFYRISAGAQVDVFTSPDSKDSARLTFGIPIRFALHDFKDIGYKGLLQVGPSLGTTWHRNGDNEFLFGFTAALSAQKYLFSQQFDRL